jgi:hypothetical protein
LGETISSQTTIPKILTRQDSSQEQPFDITTPKFYSPRVIYSQNQPNQQVISKAKYPESERKISPNNVTPPQTFSINQNQANFSTLVQTQTKKPIDSYRIPDGLNYPESFKKRTENS